MNRRSFLKTLCISPVGIALLADEVKPEQILAKEGLRESWDGLPECFADRYNNGGLCRFDYRLKCMSKSCMYCSIPNSMATASSTVSSDAGFFMRIINFSDWPPQSTWTASESVGDHLWWFTRRNMT